MPHPRDAAPPQHHTINNVIRSRGSITRPNPPKREGGGKGRRRYVRQNKLNKFRDAMGDKASQSGMAALAVVGVMTAFAVGTARRVGKSQPKRFRPSVAWISCKMSGHSDRNKSALLQNLLYNEALDALYRSIMLPYRVLRQLMQTFGKAFLSHGRRIKCLHVPRSLE